MIIDLEAKPVPEAPYRGIEAFRFIDQQIFSARDEEVWNLLNSIMLYRGVMLYGESGVGKSSLVNAGLIPAALEKLLVPHMVRLQPRLGEEFALESISTVADGEPPYLPSLLKGEGSPARVVLSAEEFERQIDALRSPPSLDPFAGPPAELRPLLIFDQFEEFITLFEDAMRGEAVEEAPKAQAKVLDILLKLLQDELLPVKLLFVFREDYLAKLNVLFRHYPDLLDQYLQIQPLRTDELHTIVRAPFTRLPNKFRPKISEGLAEEIIAKIEERSDGGTVNLSEVQIVCLKLWESDSPAELFKHRGIQGIIEDYFSDELDKFPDHLRDPAVAALGHMLTSFNTRNFISGVELINRVQAEHDMPSEVLTEALRALTQTRLVRREYRNNLFFYEIVSEFLVPWIIQQKAVWQERIKLLRYEEEKKQLERKSAQTEDQLRHEQQRASRLKWTTMSLLLFIGLLVVIVSFILYMYRHRLEAAQLREQAAEARAKAAEAIQQAEGERLRSAAVIDVLKLLSSQNKQEKLSAIRQVGSLAEKYNLPRELGLSLLAITVTDQDPEVSKAASELLAQATSANPDLAKSIATAADIDAAVASKLPLRIYIQIETGAQRQRALYVKSELEKRGYIVPNIEEVGAGRAPRRDQLRYYLSSDEPKARETVRALQSLSFKINSPTHLRRYEKLPSVRPGQFELWFASETPQETEREWFVTINFAPDTAERKNRLLTLLSPIIVGYVDGQVSFPGPGVVEMGPYSNARAEEVGAALRQTLRGSMLSDVTVNVGRRR